MEGVNLPSGPVSAGCLTSDVRYETEHDLEHCGTATTLTFITRYAPLSNHRRLGRIGENAGNEPEETGSCLKDYRNYSPTPLTADEPHRRGFVRMSRFRKVKTNGQENVDQRHRP